MQTTYKRAALSLKIILDTLARYTKSDESLLKCGCQIRYELDNVKRQENCKKIVFLCWWKRNKPEISQNTSKQTKEKRDIWIQLS